MKYDLHETPLAAQACCVHTFLYSQADTFLALFLSSVAMAGNATRGLLLMSLLLIATWASTEAAVTVINGAMVPVDVAVHGTHVTVKTGSTPVSIDVKGNKEQKVQVSMGKGKKPIFVDVKDGDTIVLIPDFLGGGSVNINVNGIFKGHF